MCDYLWENWQMIALCLASFAFTVACLYFGLRLLIDVD